jgi:hypothetical protein
MMSESSWLISAWKAKVSVSAAMAEPFPEADDCCGARDGKSLKGEGNERAGDGRIWSQVEGIIWRCGGGGVLECSTRDRNEFSPHLSLGPKSFGLRGVAP